MYHLLYQIDNVVELEKFLGELVEHHDNVDIINSPPDNENEMVVQYDNDSSGNINLETNIVIHNFY